MVLDSEEQRQILLNALLNVKIEGNYEGIAQEFPKITAVVEAVRQAEVADAKSSG